MASPGQEVIHRLDRDKWIIVAGFLVLYLVYVVSDGLDLGNLLVWD